MNSSPTVMHQALATAGVRLPTVAERVWNMIKDRPNSTAVDIAKRLKIFRHDVASRLVDLEARKMIWSNVDRTLCPDGVFRQVKHFRTDLASYQVLARAVPIKHRVKKAPAMTNAIFAPPAPAAPIEAPAYIAPDVRIPEAAKIDPPPTQDQLVREYVDGLSVAAARAMYAYLDKVFGGTF